MANVITTKIEIIGTTHAVVYMTIAADGTTPISAQTVYSSSATATLNSDTDPLTCTLEALYGSVSSSATATPVVTLSFAATTPILAIDIPAKTNPTIIDFLDGTIPMGGLKNTATTGRTGDITMTATGLASGDAITVVLKVRRN